MFDRRTVVLGGADPCLCKQDNYCDTFRGAAVPPIMKSPDPGPISREPPITPSRRESLQTALTGTRGCPHHPLAQGKPTKPQPSWKAQEGHALKVIIEVDSEGVVAALNRHASQR